MKRFKNLHKKNKIKLILSVLILLAILILSSSLSILLAILTKSPRTDFSSLKESLAQTSTLYDKKGHFIEDVDTRESRTLVEIGDIPQDLQNAFLAIEDQKFYQHKGLDIRNILASLRSNLVSGQIVRGGSTISQQLVKNSYLSNEKTLGRKLQEAYLTLRMENEIEKDQILELYLNRIDLGFGSYGVQTAARNYFSKEVRNLSLAESALLAGIVKSPAKYQPIHRIPVNTIDPNNPNILGYMEVNGMNMALVRNEKAFERQALVLKVMEKAGYISKKERQRALSEDVKFKPYIPEKSPYSSYVSDYIMDQAALELAKNYSISLEEAREKVATGGLKIFSTLDGNLQKNLEELFIDFPTKVVSQGKNQGANFLSFSLDQSNNIIDQEENVLFFLHNNLFSEDFDLILSADYFQLDSQGNLTLNTSPFNIRDNGIEIKDTYYINRDGNLLTYDMGLLHLNTEDYKIEREKILIPKASLEKNKDLISITEDNVIFSSEFIDYPQTPTLQPQSTALILDNNSGEIRAFIGGLDLRNSNKRLLNRLYSQRQPGTALLPFSVYFPALASGESLGNVYDDVPQMTDGRIWPLDPQEDYLGYINLKKAIALQKPSIAVSLLKAHGLDASLKSLEMFGIYSKQNPNKDFLISPKENKDRNDFTLDSLALGNLVKGIDNPSLTRAYSSIANNGNAYDPHLISKILDSKGQVLIHYKDYPSKEIISPEDAFLLRDALSETDLAKYVRNNSSKDFFGLLGLNKFHSDYHVFGSTPDYSIGLWIGADTPKLSLSNNKDLVISLTNHLVESLDGREEFPGKPSSILQVEVSNKTGYLASKATYKSNTAEKVFYKKGKEPKQVTKSYTRKLICSESNMLATTYCPYDQVVAKYFFVRPKGYNPKEFGGIYPADYYSVPYRYCNIHKRYEPKEQEKDTEGRDNNNNNNEDNNRNDKN